MPQVEVTETALPLELVVDQLGLGPVTGLSPTVAVRNISLGFPWSYLDWSDMTFKTSGWTTKNQVMTEVGGGFYQQILDVAALTLPDGTYFSAEYNVNNGMGIAGADMDTFEVVEVQGQVNLLRQGLTNRLWEAPGNPGTLVLYADDGVTPLLEWSLTDTSGGGVVASPGAPARRSASS
jgi:hypothetical protein